MEREREKKKLLLVAVSVGVFLVIVISATILIFTPKTSGSAPSRPIAAGSAGTRLAGEPERTQPASLDVSDMVRNNNVRGMQQPPSASAVQETNFYINGEKPLESYTVETSEEGASARVVINVPKPSTAAVPDTPAEPPRQTVKRQAVAVKPPAKPAPPKPPAPKPPAAKPAPRPEVKTAAKPAPAKTNSDYWVQTGAFTAKVRAEGVKETLALKGITSIIENREMDGKTWYRVRVGPYTSENEANFWLSLVRAIDGFADSQVRQTAR